MHPLEVEYGLTCERLLDSLSKRFRARVTLEGAVAEEQMAEHLRKAQQKGVIERFEEHDLDGHADFSIWISGRNEPLLAECKNVRNHEEAYRKGGEVIAYKVETQKTRTSNSDASSRYYDTTQFDILGVCLGKKTKDWRNFVFVATHRLARHKAYPGKLAVMQPVPLPYLVEVPWYDDIGDLIEAEFEKK